MAALLTIESQSSDKVALYLAECRDLGVPVLPPDINKSNWEFVVEPDGVRFGLGAVKGAGEGAIRSVIEARKALGRVGSLFELAEGIDLRLVNKKVFESLIKAGAFDALIDNGAEEYLGWRARLFSGLDRILDHGSRHQKDRDQGQSRLFGGDSDEVGKHDDTVSLPAARRWTDTEALAFEKEALGLYITGHPLQRYAEAIAIVGARRLGDMVHSDPDCWLPGSSRAVRQLKTKRGDRMAVFMLEDEVAKVEAVVFPEAFGRYGGLVQDDAMLMVRGKYERDEETSRLVVAELTPLEVIREKAVREVEILLEGKGLETMVDARAGGGARATFRRSPRVTGHERRSCPNALRVRAATARRIRPSDGFVREVEAVCGTGTVVLK